MTLNQKVDYLRQFGRVRIRHYRYIQGICTPISMYEIRYEGIQDEILPNGGMTEASLVSEDGYTTLIAKAKCSTKDKFVRHDGADLAIDRLMPLVSLLEKVNHKP